MTPKCTSYVLVHEDGRVFYSEVVEGCEADAFAKLEAEHGKFTAHKCSKDDFPTDRTFRDAWEWKDGKVNVHLGKAQAIAARRMASDAVRSKRIAEAKEHERAAMADQKIAGAKTLDELKAALRG